MAYTEPQNLTTITKMFNYANEVSDGIFGIGLILSIYIIIWGYLTTKGEKVADSAAAAGFITSMLGVIIYVMGLIEGWHLFATFTTFILAVVWTLNSKD